MYLQPADRTQSCVKVEVAVPNKPTVSVDVIKQHFNQQQSVTVCP